jgi:hypothetical protein
VTRSASALDSKFLAGSAIMVSMCDHTTRTEKNIVKTIVQRCNSCGMVREHNPKLKRVLPVTDPELWTEWAEGHELFDKFFENSSCNL